MPDDSNQDYLEARREYCAAQADVATDPGVASIHREFARLYEQTVQAGKADPSNSVKSRLSLFDQTR